MSLNDFASGVLKLKLLNKGFTLLEILIALGVLGIVTAVSIPNLRNFNRSQEIDGAASQLVNILNNAQSSAASRIQCPAGEVASSWQINLNVSGSSDTYTMVSNCETLGARTVYSGPFAADNVGQTSFSAVTDMCGAGIDAVIRFINRQMSYQCAAGAFQTGTPIEITLTGSGLSRTVIVDPGGIIRIE